jgi:putative hydrolase of the HAD superfamily
MIEALAFDFGKVIGFFDHGIALAKLARHTDMTEAEMYAAIYDGELEDEFESGRIDEQEFLRRFRALCRLRCPADEIAPAVADVFWPNEALCALIPRWKMRYRLVLGSNTNPIHSRHFVAQFADTLRHFDAVLLSHEVGARKPGRGFFEKVISAAGCRPQQCVFVDDLASNVAGASACGMQGIVYTGTEDLLAQLRALGVDGPIATT